MINAGDTAAYNLHRQIDLERRLLEQLRGVREYQASLLGTTRRLTAI